jgi:segregation and condensation protein B
VSDAAELARVVEALLFLSSDPLSVQELVDATGADGSEIDRSESNPSEIDGSENDRPANGQEAVAQALALLAEQYAPGRRGIQLRELAGGYTLTSDPAAEDAARRLFSRPRAATLSPAQAETLAIVAYLQPISRP